MSDTAIQPPNAFSASFLEALRKQDEPFYAEQAELEGPWVIRQKGDQFEIFRSWESAELGYEPEARVNVSEVALILLAALPALGRDRLFKSRDSRSGRQALVMEDNEVGDLRVFNSDLLTGAHFLACVARSPWSLAALVQAAGPLTMEKVGQILYGKLNERRNAQAALEVAP
ncbi:MAG TPA: hypothetical protein VHC97_23810 [Thermoanaerobaculia bacterium]|jgi:hypothetical protein|nr:hypothetical protein [Thermoanaerobaculia bacterium]